MQRDRQHQTCHDDACLIVLCVIVKKLCVPRSKACTCLCANGLYKSVVVEIGRSAVNISRKGHIQYKQTDVPCKKLSLNSSNEQKQLTITRCLGMLKPGPGK